MLKHIIELKPYGEYAFDISPVTTTNYRYQKPMNFDLKNNEDKCKNFFRILWNKSRRFGLIGFQNSGDNFFLPKEEIKIYGRTKKTLVTDSYNKDVPIIICKTSEESFEKVFGEINNFFWSKDGWEDLFLINGDKLIFAMCSHEEYAFMFGDKDLFFELGIKNFEKYTIPDKKWKLEIKL